MGIRGQFLPFYHQWAAFIAKTPETYLRYCRHRFRYVPSIENHYEASASSSIPAQIKVRFRNGEHRQYYGNYGRGGDDGDSEDLREQKSAFLRALEGSETKNAKMDGKRNEVSSARSPKTRMQRQYIHKSNIKDSFKSRKRDNKSGSSTKVSVPSKKLTLDEFFSNLEKQKVEELSSKPATRKRSRVRMTSKNEKFEKQPLHPKYDCSGGKSQAAPAANMDSFFDEVNAFMDRKGKEQEERKRATTTALTNESDSVASTPTFRASISDLIPPRSSPTNNSSESNDSFSPIDDRNSVGYNCSIESWDRYSELIEEVIEGPRFLIKIQSKKSKDEAEKKRQIGQVVEWLRSETPLVETSLPTLDLLLTEGVLVRSEDPGNEMEENGEGEKELNREGMYTSRRKIFREELNAQKELFLNEMCWTKKQYEGATGALVAIGNLCARNCTAPPLDMAWSKLKELGYPMKNKDVLHNYLYVASTFSLPRRKSSLTSERINDGGMGGDDSLPSVLDILSGTSDSTCSISSDGLGYEIDLSAEVALCHDFLHEATEQSTGIHVQRLVQLGKANAAEALLEASVVSSIV